MGKKKKYSWWCELCYHEWKAKSINEDICPKCASNSIWLDKRGGKREEPILSVAPEHLVEACKRLEELSDKEVYEGSCDCHNHEHQVCDNCQCSHMGDLEEDINQGHYFEIMDRVHIIQCNLDDFVYDHPAITPKQQKRIRKVQKKLTKIYQWASKEWAEWGEDIPTDTRVMKVSG